MKIHWEIVVYKGNISVKMCCIKYIPVWQLHVVRLWAHFEYRPTDSRRHWGGGGAGGPPPPKEKKKDKKEKRKKKREKRKKRERKEKKERREQWMASNYYTKL